MNAKRLTPFFFLRLPDNVIDGFRATVAFCGAALLGLAAPAATAVLFGWVVPQTDFPMLGWLVTGMLAAALAGGALEMVGGRNWLRVGGRAEQHWVPTAWARLIAMPFSWLLEAGPVESGARAQAVHEIVLRSMEWTPRLHAAVAVALANVLFLFFINSFLAIVGLLCALCAWLALIGLNQSRIQALETEFHCTETLHSEALQWIREADALRLAGAWDTVQKRAAQLMAACLAARHQTGWGDGWRAALFAGATALPGLILFAAVDQTDLDIGPFLAFFVAFGSLIGSLRIVADVWPIIAEIRAMTHRAQPLWEGMNIPPEKKQPSTALLGGLSMEGVHFRYSPDLPPVLTDFSMQIAPGELVGLTGPSGCGKSTVLKLLTGLETPDAGRILLDQWNLTELSLESLHESIGVVWQRGAWYSGNLLRNISGESELSAEEAWHAAELAGLADDIRALPMQMQTLVAEGATNFSAGQRQQILIARALARRPRILIFDEATLSLDRCARLQLMDCLAKLPITRIVISHQVEHLSGVDRIIPLVRHESEPSRGS